MNRVEVNALAMDTMQAIEGAEKLAEQTLKDAKAESERLVHNAVQKSEEIIRAAVSQAENQNLALIKQARADAEKQGQKLLDALDAEMETLKTFADEKTGKASAAIKKSVMSA